MSLANWFNKPRWKNKDATVRATAVSTGQEAELLSALPEIARSDSSPVVRAAATRRLQDLQTLLEIATGDTDQRVQKNARQRFARLAEKLDDSGWQRYRQTLEAVSFVDLIQTLAETAEHPGVRGLFQRKIRSQGRLGDLLLVETDPELRQQLATRLEKPATIQRVLKQLGKKDPALTQILEQQLQAQDPASQQQQAENLALGLCEQLESLIHGSERSGNADGPANPQQRLKTIEQEWRALLAQSEKANLALPAALQQRFSGALNTARLMLDPNKRATWLAEQKARREKEQAQTAFATAYRLWQQFQQDARAVAPGEAQQALQALQSARLSTLNDKNRAAATQLLSEWPSALSQQATEDATAPTADDEAEKLLQAAQQALQKNHFSPRQLSRLRQQWEALIASAPDKSLRPDLQQSFNQCMGQLAEKIEQQKQQRDTAAEQAIALIEQVDAAISVGQLAEAKHLFNQHVQKKKIAGHGHPLIKRHKHRIDRSWNALKELRQWQKWSNDKVRQRLIDELKATPTSGWHPDAILAKLKEGSAQWKALEEQERLEGDRFPVRNTKLWNEFRALQDALFELAEPYLAERSHQWNKNLQAVEQLLDSLAKVQPEEEETRSISTHVRQAIDWLKKLETLPPAERGRVAGRLREQINRLDKPLKQRYAEARQRKETLIEKSQALLASDDLTEAIAQAKALQRQWKQAGFVPPSQERGLWKRFRAAQDAVFNRLDAEKQQAKARHQAARAEAEAFLADIRSQLADARNPEAIKALAGQLLSGWEQHRESGLNRSFQELQQALKEAAENFQHRQQLQALQSLKQAGELCSALEAQEITAEQARQRWQETIETATQSLGKLARSPAWKKQSARFQALLENDSPATDSEATARYLHTLIAAEFLTGSETPAEFQEQRNAYQIDRLARRMSGESLPDSVTEAHDLLAAIYTLEGVDPVIRKNSQRRQQALEDALFELIRNP